MLANEPRGFDIFKDSERVVTMETPVNAVGDFRRVSILRTPMKHPLVRVEETLRKEGHLGEERVLNQVAAVADHVMVKVQPGLAEVAVAALARKHGGRVRKKLTAPDTYLIEIPANEIESLPQAVTGLTADKALVAYAEPDYVVHALAAPNDASYSQLWGLSNTSQTGGTADADIDAPEAWDITTGSSGIVLGVIDTGIDYNHPDLAANIWTNPNEIPANGLDDDGNGYVDDIRGWNFVGDTNNPMDDHFHGTHCAGTIGAVGNNGSGVVGVNWQVKMIPLKFLSSSGGGVLSDAIEAVRYATRVGARLTSNSWGGGGFSQTLKDAIDDASAAGSLFVAAAGNDGSNNDAYPSYPASYASANVVSVAATDHADRLAGFSNYGKTSVHLAAPGVGILSTFPTTTTSAMTAYGLPTSYARISGTSMATPHVSGVAALALAQTPGLTPLQLRSRLMLRSDRLPHLVGILQTAGRLNAFNVVNPNWQPGPAQPGMTEFALSDSEGNSDGYPNPGEILRLTPELLNLGGQTATGVSVTLVSNQSSAVVLTAGPVSVGNLEPFVPVTPSAPFRVQINAGVADNTVLDFDLIIRANGLSDVHIPATLVVSKPPPRAEVVVNFAVGEITADPARNLVYVLNRTHRRVLALDTASGQVAAIGTLAGGIGIEPPIANGTLATGQSAVSHDGTKLFVALSEAKAIQIFALPALTSLGAFQLDFVPESLAVAAHGRLYASSTDYWGPIREIDPATGQVTKTFDKGFINGQYYMHARLRMNRAGTRLFVGETGLWTVGGPARIDEFDVSVAGAPVLVTRHPYTQVYMSDFAIDEARQRLYSTNGGRVGGIYGVQLTEMATGQYGTAWPLDTYAVGVALLPDSPVVYGASSQSLRKFRRSDGLTLGEVRLDTNNSSVPPRGVVITPNGHLVYVTTEWLGVASGGVDDKKYRVGIVGLNSLSIVNPPPPPAAAALSLTGVDLSDVEGNQNSTPNPGEILQLKPWVTNSGGTAAANASVTVSTDTAGVTILAPASSVLGTVAAGARVSPAAPFRVQVGAGVVNGTVARFTFTVQWDGLGTTKTFVHTITIRTQSVTFESTASFQFGEILADRTRNFVYLLDKRNLRLLAFDTNSGHIVTSVPLAGPRTVSGVVAGLGRMAQSIDGSLLYVALKKAKMIQVFALPELTPVATWSFDFEPVDLAAGAAGRLYATSTSATRKLIQIDAANGTVLGQSGANFGANALLRANAAGTRIFGVLDYATTIYEYDVAGTTPLQLAVHNTAYGSIDDIEIDEIHQRIYLSSGYPYGVRVFDLTGQTAEQLWPYGVPYGSAVGLLPGGAEVVGASGDSNNGNLRRFQRSTGTPLGDYVVGTGNAEVMRRGVAITPNRRIVYVKSIGTGAPEYPVDNSLHTLGMAGGSAISTDIPGALPVQLKALAVTDPATNSPPGNNNGYPNAGETVQMSPTFKNVSEFQLPAMSVELLSADGLTTVVAPATRTAGNLASYAEFTPVTPFKVTLPASLSDGQPLRFNWRVTHSGGTEQLLATTFYVVKPQIAEVQINFAPGPMVADRTRNLAYVIDKTNQKLLAIDTAAGTVVARSPLAAAPSTGQMALSPDGTRLYVALSVAKKVQVFALPSLEPVNLFDLDFQPASLAVGGDTRLYATVIASPSVFPRQIEPESGQVLGQFGKNAYPGSTILRVSGDGSLLYLTSISGLNVDEYALAEGTLPSYRQDYPLNISGSAKDFAVDETYRRLVTTSGGVYGLQTTEQDTGLAGPLWPFDVPYGVSLCFLPGDAFIYGGSGGTYDGRIRRFRRDTGQPAGDFEVGDPGGLTGSLMDRNLVITQNGRLLYAKSKFTGSSTPPSVSNYQYWLGVVGRSSLTINSLNESPLANVGSNSTTRLSNPLTLSGTLSDDGGTGSLTRAWSLASGPGQVVCDNPTAASTTANFSSIGTYRLRLTVSDGQKAGSDELTVTVLPDKPQISITATKPMAYENGLVPGEFTISRTGGSAGSLIVNLVANGTATTGNDYAALPATATIPDGATSVALAVTPMTDASAESDETLIATIGTSSNYDPGVSTLATVTVRDRNFTNWQTDKLGGVAPELRLPGADPNHNGLANLLEFALGLDPLSSSSVGWPTGGLTDPIDGQRYLRLTFRRLRGASGVTYTIETTGTLLTWPATPGPTVEQSAIPNADGTETVIVRDTVPESAGARFMRLRVTQP